MVYRIANVLTWIALGLLSTYKVVGVENIPKTSPFLLMANHVAWLDPPMLGTLLPRPINFMAKEELFRHWFIRWVVVNYGAFSIRRGEGDRQALREALKILEGNGVLGIFPEGTRSRDCRLQAGQPGVALLALRSGAPVVPVAIIGTEKVWHLASLIKRPHFTVVVGEPFRLSGAEAGGRKSLDSLSDQMMCRLAELLPPELRGVYGDRLENTEERGSGEANLVVGQ